MGSVVLLAVLSLTFLNKHNPNMRMRALMREGRIASGNSDYDEAVGAYRLAISLRPKNVRAYLLLAEASISDGEPEDALFFLRLGMRATGNEQIRAAYNNLLGVLAADD
jgi:tetratricopeptide (TPR) repeat protein